jgi:hypothetical protein
VQRAFIRPPAARMGPITAQERKALIAKSPVKGKYDETLDSESAFEMLERRVKKEAAPADEGGRGSESSGGVGGWLGGIFGTNRKRGERLSTGQVVAREVARTVTNRVAGQVVSELAKSLGGGKIGGTVGRAIVRGTLGGILRR